MDKKPITLPPNTIIGTWRPTNLLGQGGQGAVWAAKPVNVKHTPPRALKASFATDDQAKARFVREVETLRGCECPNILKIYDQHLEWTEHVPGLPAFAYYVAEKCQGSMTQRQAHLGDARRRLGLFKQACTAVSYLHSLPDPVLHRDIKPDNFLISQEFATAVLADFGIARPLSDSSLTQAFEIVGTPYYRAPEVLHGSRGTVESDVYGLGRLLEWMLTGDVSTDMATRPVPRGLELEDEACNILDGIIAKATQVTPAHRYRTVQELADQVPDLWLSAKPRPKPGPMLAETSAPTVLSAALTLARSNDLLGWRLLENQLRRDLVERVAAWRGQREHAWRGDRNKEAGVEFTDSVLDLAMGRFALGLTGVYANNPAFADQRQVVEDLLSIPNWNLGGTTAIVETPRSLAYIFHFLHGAVCMAYGQPDLALQLARMPIPRSDRWEAAPLWKDHAIIGWPKLLGGNASWAWEYLRNLRTTRPVLEQLFALQSDYDAGLAAYSMLMVLHEVADDAATSTPAALATPENFGVDFPPMFIAMTRETVASAARRTLSSRPVVERVASLAGARLEVMRGLWTERRKKILAFGQEALGRWGYLDHMPLPETLG